MFDAIENESFDQRELRILSFWEKNNVFKRSVEKQSYNPHFSFYDGPPFATGLPHYGHLLAGTIKDVVPRYKTMKGYYVPRRFGWDCHGLPVENEIEKANNLSGAKSIEEFGIDNFNEECRKIVLRYTQEWKSIVNRMGRWVDFDHVYKTMDLTFMESVWWVFKQLFEKGLIYEGYKVMPFSAKLGTPLSNFEASENYKDVDDPSLTVTFPLIDDENTSLLVWTTTPWTLISNLAIMVGPDIEYVKVLDEESKKYYILAASRLPEYFKNTEKIKIIESFKGSSLEGTKYIPIFSYFEKHKEKNAFRIILEENVSTEEGTGLVHTAPAFGEMDFYACQKAGIELVCPVDNNGKFTEVIPEYTGLFVKDADKDIIKRLKISNRVFHHATLRHRYPFCWRSDTPLIYKVVQTWFVSVETLKEKLLKANEKIHWTPAHIKYGRFGKWLEGARDWAISRNRYWGTPIPIWRAKDGEILVIGSIAELENYTNVEIKDIHRHFIDQLIIEKNGKTFTRVSEVFDCWFESGSMPYAQNHYPFENKDLFQNNFPADFIAEGLDQTRGWFYTLTVLSTALFDKPAFKNVIVNGIILAEDGAKMSKRLKNYPDPMEVVKKYGADAIRLYLMHSPAVHADDLCFKESGVELVLRQILLPLWNAYSFFITYARIYEWRPIESFQEKTSEKPEAIIDQWILSLLNKLIKEVENGMDSYDLSSAVEPFIGFVDQLTNWYIRRSRRRFWSDKPSLDRDQAFNTLYQVLMNLCKLAAPFIPFITESIYANLRNDKSPDSVHLCRFPNFKEKERDIHLENAMEAVQKAVGLGHALRKEKKLKVRQPLSKATIVSNDETFLSFLEEQKHLIADELNVKEVIFDKNESNYVQIIAKPNFRTLGKKVGKLMPEVQKRIQNFTLEEINNLQKGNLKSISIQENIIELNPEDIEISRIVKEGNVSSNLGNITIILDTNLNEELINEGYAREVVNKINTMRRDQGFDVTDRIKVKIDSTEAIKTSIHQFYDYISNEILASTIDFERIDSGSEWDLNGEYAKIIIIKI